MLVCVRACARGRTHIKKWLTVVRHASFQPGSSPPPLRTSAYLVLKRSRLTVVNTATEGKEETQASLLPALSPIRTAFIIR